MTKNKVILRGGEEMLKTMMPLIIEISNLLEDSRRLAVSGANDSVRVRRSGKPKVVLLFSAIPDGINSYTPQDSSISFRLMNKTPTSLSLADVNAMARRVKAAFASPRRFTWQKGRNMVSYSDWDRGYQLQILCKERAEGRRVVEQVLDIQGHRPQWEYCNYIVSESPSVRYPTVPDKEIVLGVSRRRKVERPEVKVRFDTALLMVEDRIGAVLVDTTGKFSGAIAN